MRNSVRSGERAGRSKFNSKPLCESPEPISTFADASASTTSRGAGIGTGPM
jgi:hypothetical protein